jgi:hypothetical protein
MSEDKKPKNPGLGGLDPCRFRGAAPAGLSIHYSYGSASNASSFRKKASTMKQILETTKARSPERDEEITSMGNRNLMHERLKVAAQVVAIMKLEVVRPNEEFRIDDLLND